MRKVFILTRSLLKAERSIGLLLTQLTPTIPTILIVVQTNLTSKNGQLKLLQLQLEKVLWSVFANRF